MFFSGFLLLFFFFFESSFYDVFSCASMSMSIHSFIPILLRLSDYVFTSLIIKCKENTKKCTEKPKHLLAKHTTSGAKRIQTDKLAVPMLTHTI